MHYVSTQIFWKHKYVDYSNSLLCKLCRPDLEELSLYLHQLGASEVVTEEQLASYRIKEILKVDGDCVMGQGAITCFPNRYIYIHTSTIQFQNRKSFMYS